MTPEECIVWFCRKPRFVDGAPVRWCQEHYVWWIETVLNEMVHEIGGRA